MDLPDKASRDIHLAVATEEELHQQQLANSSEWRGALSLEAYMRREVLLYAQEHTKEGGLVPWVLVYQPRADGPRKVLCGCETLNKRALVGREGRIEEVLCRGIASVFCPDAHRGRGYAGRMMDEVAQKLRSREVENDGPCLFSVLYSDIGKKFYTARGWQPFPSADVTLPAESTPTTTKVRPLYSEDLARLCASDEDLIRRRLEKSQTRDRTAIAIIPDHGQIVWHHAREEFVAKELHGRHPDVKGAMVGESAGSRVYCYWTRVWTNPQEEAPDTLHILRVVVEDEAFSDFAPASPEGVAQAKDSTTARAIAQLFGAAQREAAQWHLKEVMLWNPSSTALAAARMIDDGARVVHRETESIASLQWYGEGSWRDVDWICNEKYAWC